MILKPTRHTHSHRPIKKARHPWVEHNPALVPATSQAALKEAMRLEGIPAASFDDLLWIMAQESGGIVDSRNHQSTARGLYQLLEAQFSLNPHGIKSFGNATEECQGGIHYIVGRYGSAATAVAFWRKHHWY